MELLFNRSEKDSFQTQIKKLFSKNSQIDIAVAFLKSSGLDLVERELKAALKRGAKVNLIIRIPRSLLRGQRVDNLER